MELKPGPEAAILLLFALFASAAVGHAQPSKTAPKNLYILNDEADDRWCAYTSESEWRSKVDSPKTEARTVARVEYTSGRISDIYVTSEDDPAAGDWTVSDVYFLDKSENLHSLNRTINVIPGRIKELEIWAIHNGKPIKQSTRDPDSLKPVKPAGEWVPSVPIFPSVRDFPFWPLIHDRRQEILQEILSVGSACITVKRRRRPHRRRQCR
jgi:hypothetical protein